MAVYQYKCDSHGAVDVTQPIGTAPPSWPCPTCQAEAVRVYSPPMLSLGSRALMAAIDRTEKSRDEPEVVTSLPTTGRRRQTPTAPLTPALARLPRP